MKKNKKRMVCYKRYDIYALSYRRHGEYEIIGFGDSSDMNYAVSTIIDELDGYGYNYGSQIIHSYSADEDYKFNHDGDSYNCGDFDIVVEPAMATIEEIVEMAVKSQYWDFYGHIRKFEMEDEEEIDDAIADDNHHIIMQAETEIWLARRVAKPADAHYLIYDGAIPPNRGIDLLVQEAIERVVYDNLDFRDSTGWPDRYANTYGCKIK